MKTYSSTYSFYLDDKRRAHSREKTYGTSWRTEGWAGTCRVSFVEATDEVYAVYQDGDSEFDGMVVVFPVAVGPPAPQQELPFHHLVDMLLKGWEEVENEGLPNSFRWVVSRICDPKSHKGNTIKDLGRVVAETDCPVCGVLRGDKCVSMSGVARGDSHEPRWELLDAPLCPTCFSQPGQPCAAASGRISRRTHAGRRRAKEAAKPG